MLVNLLTYSRWFPAFGEHPAGSSACGPHVESERRDELLVLLIQLESQTATTTVRIRVEYLYKRTIEAWLKMALDTNLGLVHLEASKSVKYIRSHL